MDASMHWLNTPDADDAESATVTLLPVPDSTAGSVPLQHIALLTPEDEAQPASTTQIPDVGDEDGGVEAAQERLDLPS